MYPYTVSEEITGGADADEMQKRPLPPDKKVLELILDALRHAKGSCIYYGCLADQTQNGEERGVLRRLQMDAQKHEKLFSSVFYQITGAIPPPVEPEQREIYSDMIFNFQRSLFDELREIELNRTIYFSFLNIEIRDILYEIITDGQANALTLNHLYLKAAMEGYYGGHRRERF